MYVTGKYFYKKYLDTNLKINVDTVHVTYKKHKTNFHAIFTNKVFIYKPMCIFMQKMIVKTK
jgi:hypothetical protein